MVMYSKVKVGGHPLHPMLVAFPVVLYTATPVCFVVQRLSGDLFWFRTGWIANCAGVCAALIAALPGFVDWAFGVPRGTPARRTGLLHMSANVGALVVFVVNLLLVRQELDSARPDVTPFIVLSALGVALTVVAGFLGWKLVQTHHVGIDLHPGQERFEPQPSPPIERRGEAWKGPAG